MAPAGQPLAGGVINPVESESATTIGQTLIGLLEVLEKEDVGRERVRRPQNRARGVPRHRVEYLRGHHDQRTASEGGTDAVERGKHAGFSRPKRCWVPEYGDGAIIGNGFRGIHRIVECRGMEVWPSRNNKAVGCRRTAAQQCPTCRDPRHIEAEEDIEETWDSIGDEVGFVRDAGAIDAERSAIIVVQHGVQHHPYSDVMRLAVQVGHDVADARGVRVAADALHDGQVLDYLDGSAG